MKQLKYIYKKRFQCSVLTLALFRGQYSCNIVRFCSSAWFYISANDFQHSRVEKSQPHVSYISLFTSLTRPFSTFCSAAERDCFFYFFFSALIPLNLFCACIKVKVHDWIRFSSSTAASSPCSPHRRDTAPWKAVGRKKKNEHFTEEINS